jgi:dienelactone hydrolase
VDYDRARVVTAGISKGGEVAVWLALSGALPARGFIAIAPGGPRIDEPERLLPLVEASREQGIRGYLIVGDQDTFCYEPTLKLAAFLKQHDVAHELEVHPGAGHGFPPDFEQSLRRALEFIIHP